MYIRTEPFRRSKILNYGNIIYYSDVRAFAISLAISNASIRKRCFILFWCALFQREK